MKQDSTTTKRRVIAAVAALAGIAAGALLSAEDASARRSITGKQIADSSLTGKDLRDGTVTTRDIRDGSLSPEDYQPDEISTLLTVEGDPHGYWPTYGPDGPQGDPGLPGVRGRSGITALELATTASDIGSQVNGTVTTNCPGTKKAISGGVLIDGLATSAPINVSAPLDNGVGWQSMVRNGGSQSITAIGWVICVTAH